MIRARLDAGDVQQLCAGIAEGLHAAAQPLTVLRARLDLDVLAEMNAAQLRSHAAAAAEQIEELCLLHEYLLQLVDAATIEARREAVAVNSLLDDVAEGLALVLGEAGMTFRCNVEKGCGPVAIDLRRTRQALSEAVLIAFRLSKAADSIEMNASQVGGRVCIAVKNGQVWCEALAARQRLALAVVTTGIRSQGGEVFCKTTPLAIHIQLPVARGAATEVVRSFERMEAR